MEIKKSSVNSIDLYVVDKYPNPGIYLNEDETGYKCFMYVGNTTVILFLSDYDSAPEFLKENVVKNKNSDNLNEDFVLKMLSIATKNDKYNEL